MFPSYLNGEVKETIAISFAPLAARWLLRDRFDFPWQDGNGTSRGHTLEGFQGQASHEPRELDGLPGVVAVDTARHNTVLAGTRGTAFTGHSGGEGAEIGSMRS